MNGCTFVANIGTMIIVKAAVATGRVVVVVWFLGGERHLWCEAVGRKHAAQLVVILAGRRWRCRPLVMHQTRIELLLWKGLFNGKDLLFLFSLIQKEMYALLTNIT